MTLIPSLGFDWLNGWLLLVICGAVLGSTVWIFPKHVIAKPYDKSHWPHMQHILTTVGKRLSTILFAMLAPSPFRIGRPVLVIGNVLSIIGLSGLVVALFNFKNAPPNRPATNGLYRLSLNPQWLTLVTVFVGARLAIGSWAALLVFGLAAVCYHVRIPAEEKSYLIQYGDAHRECLARVPRDLSFF